MRGSQGAADGGDRGGERECRTLGRWEEEGGENESYRVQTVGQIRECGGLVRFLLLFL
jgi:hypothetical protein